MVKLSVGECACSKKGTAYCRTDKGYRFTGKRCTNPGERIGND